MILRKYNFLFKRAAWLTLAVVFFASSLVRAQDATPDNTSDDASSEGREAKAASDKRVAPVLPPSSTLKLEIGTGSVFWIPIDDGPENMPGGGMIDRWTLGFVKKQIAAARSSKASAIVLHIRSNGGDAFAMISIAREIQKAAPIPTIAFVYEHAWSAAAVLALACDVVYMTPSSAIGDAQVIQSGGEGGINVAPEKIASPFRAYFRMIIEKKAERSGFPESLIGIVEAMMDPGIELLEIELDGVRRIVRRSSLMGSEEKGYTYDEKKVRILRVLLQEDKLLSATSKEALLKYRFIDGIMRDRAELFAELELSGREVVEIKKNWEDNLSRFVSGHFISGILMMIGMLGVFLILKVGAIGTGVSVMGFAFGTFFYANSIAGNASGFEIVLFLVGLLLLILEVFVIPGFGVAGIGGIICIVSSLALSMVAPNTLPGFEGVATQFDWDGFIASIGTVFVSILSAVVISFMLMQILPTVPMFNKVLLKDVAGAESSTRDNMSGVTLENLVGLDGVCKTDLRPSGTIVVNGMPYDGVTDAEFISRETSVEVVAVRMGNLLVKPAKDDEPEVDSAREVEA